MDIGSPPNSAGSLMLVAITYKAASLALLGQVNLTGEAAEQVACALNADPGVSECVILSTCNRTELYLWGREPDARRALCALAQHTGAPLDALAECALTATGDDAAMHLLRVAAGLESRVVGEMEVLGQVRAAIAAARASSAAGPQMNDLFRYAIAAGRDAQRTTDRALTPSLPRLALDAARTDARRPGLTVVLGSGAMAMLTTEELCARGLEYRVCARRPERAIRLATSPDQVVPFHEMCTELERAEVVVCATGARTPLLRVADLERIMRRRGERPLTIVDLSLPRNVEEGAGDLPGVRLLDLDDLVVDMAELQVQRRKEIVAGELQRYRASRAGRAVGHLLAQLHETVQRSCMATIERSWMESGGTAESLTATACSMANKLLHGPTVMIKNMIAAGDDAAAFAVLASYGVVTLEMKEAS